jgi:hypothetical protein
MVTAGLFLGMAACQSQTADVDGSGNGPMLSTLMDTIQFGRALTISHGCGDCHGGGPNPSAPMWLVGFRPGTEDTLFWPAKIPTPCGM